MLSKKYVFFLACVTSTMRTTESQQKKWPGISKIGETCMRDRECMRHAFCKNQQFCLCDTYYSPSLDKSTCHVTIGAPCGADNNRELCETMSNAECRQNVCTCRDNFMIDMNNSSNCIIRPRSPGDVCYHNDECKESMEMAHCIERTCECYTNYHFLNETGTCIKVRGLYEPCENDYECFVDGKYPNRLECKNGECACRKGEPGCNGTGALTRQSIFLIISMLVFREIHQTLI